LGSEWIVENAGAKFGGKKLDFEQILKAKFLISHSKSDTFNKSISIQYFLNGLKRDVEVLAVPREKSNRSGCQ